MALKLKDISAKEEKKKSSLLDLILEKKEKRLSQSPEKKRTLRPWEALKPPSINEDSKITAYEQSHISASHHRDCEDFLSAEEKMLRRIRKRAKDLFTDIKYK